MMIIIQTGFLIMVLPGKAQPDVAGFAPVVRALLRAGVAKAGTLPGPDTGLLFIRAQSRGV